MSTNTDIDPRAIIDPSAEIAEGVKIGPWSMIGPKVVIDSGTVVGPHVVVNGPTHIGKNNRIFQFASIGEECQDKKYKGEDTRLEIGDNNIFRENTTVHRGTIQDQGLTKIGSNNLFMAYSHVAHDCIVGNNVILANYVGLAGHVQLEDWVIMASYSGVHQFCKVGPHAMAAVGALVVQDVPAYLMVSGNTASPKGLNVEGLKRRGFSKEVIQELKRAYRILYRQGLSLQDALSQISEQLEQGPEMQLFIDSIQGSTRGIVR